MALCFFAPISLTITKLISILIILLWLFSGQYKLKTLSVLNNKLALASIIFFMFHVFSLIWTEDLRWGWIILRKMIEFLIFIPVLLTIAKYENFKIYLFAFSLGIFFTAIFILLTYSGHPISLPYGKGASLSPFMSSTSQGVFFAFAIFVGLSETYRNLKLDSKKGRVHSFFWVIFVILIAVINFNSDSRVGYIASLIALFVFFFMNFKFRFFLILFSSFMFLLISFSYNYSETFKSRVDLANAEISQYLNGEYKTRSSLIQRLYWSEKSIEIIRDNFFLGVGIGDFKDEMSLYAKEDKTDIRPHANPHNMYLLVFSTTGVFGFLSLLSIFFITMNKTYKEKNNMKKSYGVFLNLVFMSIMFSDTYLLGHFTQLLLAIFLSALYSKPYITQNENFNNYSKI